MASKTLSKDFKRVDDDNFEIIETRESSTNVNVTTFPKQVANFKKDMSNKILEIQRSEVVLENSLETYNTIVDELVKANEELGYKVDLPKKYTLDELKAEVMEASESN